MVNAHACGIFPAPFPDETCYSLLCRYAVRRGHLTSSQVCLDLFGHTEPLAGYLFKPFRMKDIQRWLTDEEISDGVRYGENHSCYPYYTAFLPPAHAAGVCECRIGVLL